MKKNTTTYLIIGALAIGGYLAYKKGLFSKKAEETTEETTEEKPEDTKTQTQSFLPSGASATTFATGSGGSSPVEKATAIIDIATSGKPLSEAINKAKGLLEDYKAGKVIIKTKKGQKNVKVTKKSSAEKRATRMAKRTTRKATRIAKRTTKKGVKTTM
jgi:hypothetical protein